MTRPFRHRSEPVPMVPPKMADIPSAARKRFLEEALSGVGEGAAVVELLRTMRPSMADAWLRCGERIVAGTPSRTAHLQFLQEIGLSPEDARRELDQSGGPAT